MHKYEKGDLVQHVPSGCVLKYQYDSASVDGNIVASDDYNRVGCHWKREDCQPAADHSKLVEAAEMVSDELQTRDHYVRGAFMAKLIEALADLEHHAETPKQLVAPDLHEAAKAVSEGATMTIPPGYQVDFNSMVARNEALAKSTPQTWITDRRPNEDDAWNGEVMIARGYVASCNWDGEFFDHRIEPWMPVPHSLRVKPVVDDDEYKWLASSATNGVELWTDRPDYAIPNYYWCCDYGVVSVPKNPPSFLKPGQLWEREVGYWDRSVAITHELGKWNGYWWRLAEDHSKRCEVCVHHDYHYWEDQNGRNGIPCCPIAKAYEPTYGMDGCNFKAKGE